MTFTRKLAAAVAVVTLALTVSAGAAGATGGIKIRSHPVAIPAHVR